MSNTATLRKGLSIELSSQDMAEAFCELNDDAQAQFFVGVARIMHMWPAHARVMQLHYIGAHLKNCSCSTDDARQLIDDIHSSMHSDSKHGTGE